MSTRVRAVVAAAVAVGLLTAAAPAAFAPAAATSVAVHVDAKKKPKPKPLKGAPAVLTAKGAANMVTLTWRAPAFTVDMATPPTVRYDVMQGSEVVESRTTELTYVAKDLLDNTVYPFTVTSYVNGRATGSKVVNGLTLPGIVLADPAPTNYTTLVWSPPVQAANPLTYNVYKGSNLIQSGIAGTSIPVPDPGEGKTDTYLISAVNATGEGKTVKVSLTHPKPAATPTPRPTSSSSR